MKRLKTYFIVLGLIFPSLVFAQSTIWTVLYTISAVIKYMVTIGGTLAVVAFFYGIAIFILNADNEERRKESKSILYWGVIALFVMTTIWGILGFMQRTFQSRLGPGAVQINIPVI